MRDGYVVSWQGREYDAAPEGDNVRIYLLAGGQHGPGAFPPVQTIGQQPSNPLDYRWAMKALQWW